VAFPSPPVGVTEAGSGLPPGLVANSSSSCFYRELVEDEILALNRPPQLPDAMTRVPQWHELTTWPTTQLAMGALGFRADVEDDFAKIGLDSDLGTIDPDTLERRRRILFIVKSASEAHSWCREDGVRGQAFVDMIGKVIDRCQARLPEVNRKNGRKKKGGIGGGNIPTWLEPGALAFEFAMTLPDKSTIALHLSNLQRFPLEALCSQGGPGSSKPKVLCTREARDIYTRLNQAQPKIEEILSRFSGGRLVVWAPDNSDQIPRIVAALQRIYTDNNISTQIQLLIPYNPLPGCHTPDSILDLWSHPLMQSRYNGVVREVCFLREASRCVFTASGNPVHHIKNLVAVVLQASSQARDINILSIRSDIIQDTSTGDAILIDVPAANATAIWNQLNCAAPGLFGLAITWKLQLRGRGHTGGEPRSTFIGNVATTSVILVRAAIHKVRTYCGGVNMIIGRRSMFADMDTIIADGSIAQFVMLCPAVYECVLVSPHRAIFTPRATADEFCRMLTEVDDLRSLALRYRCSSALHNAPFAKPRDLPKHLAAERHNAFADRQGGSRGSLLRLQVALEILGLDSRNHEDLAHKLLDNVSNETNTTLKENLEPESYLKPGEWRKTLREGIWTGRILLQCACAQDVQNIYGLINGRTICRDGLVHTIEVSSLSDAFLAGGAIRATLAASSSTQ